MCKARCGLKDAFVFILTSMKIEKQPNGERKLNMKKYNSLYGCCV
jgi:hypothetical protein